MFWSLYVRIITISIHTLQTQRGEMTSNNFITGFSVTHQIIVEFPIIHHKPNLLNLAKSWNVLLI